MKSRGFRGGLTLPLDESPALLLPILDLTQSLPPNPHQSDRHRSNTDAVINHDGQHDTDPLKSLGDPINGTRSPSADRAGIEHLCGLGGAGFSLARKIASGQHSNIDTLIINAAECEPMMACDQALIRESAAAIVHGIEDLLHHTGVMRAMIGIESHRTTEISLLRHALAHRRGITLHTIEPRYPTGSESLLIRVLTGRQVPVDGLPRDCGVLCFNIATAHAFGVWMREGLSQTSRIVTVAGNAIDTPRNVRVAFGVPITQVITSVEPTIDSANLKQYEVTVGGPMTGRAMHGIDETITAKTNCLIIDQPAEALPARRCIRCGQCNDVCPVNLLPQQLHWYARDSQIMLDDLQRFHLDQCIECGCCDVVCPSQIPLTAQFRVAKVALDDSREREARADLAAQRYTARELRLKRREQEKAARIAARKTELAKTRKPGSDRHTAIQDAIKRAKASRAKGSPG